MAFAACFDLHASVRTRIYEHLDLVFGVASENNRAATNIAGAKIMRIFDLAFMTNKQP